MAKRYINVAYCEADGKPLDDVRGIELDDARENGDPLPTMNRLGRALGYSRGRVRTEFTINSLISVPHEFDWGRFLRTGDLLDIAYEEEGGGQRYLLVDCRVNNVTRGYQIDGEATESIKCFALDHRPIPS